MKFQIKQLVLIQLGVLLCLGNAHGQNQSGRIDCEDFDYYPNDTGQYYLSAADSAAFLDFVIENKLFNVSPSVAFQIHHDTAALKKRLFEYFYYFSGHRDLGRVKPYLKRINDAVLKGAREIEEREAVRVLKHDIAITGEVIGYENLLFRYHPTNAPTLRYPGVFHIRVNEVLYSDANGLKVGDTVLLARYYEVPTSYYGNDSSITNNEERLVYYASVSHTEHHEVGESYLFLLDLPLPNKAHSSIVKNGSINHVGIQPWCLNVFDSNTSVYKSSDPLTEQTKQKILKYLPNHDPKN